MEDKRVRLLLTLAKEEKLLNVLFDCLDEFLDRDNRFLQQEKTESPDTYEYNQNTHNKLQTFYQEFINCKESTESENRECLDEMYCWLEDLQFYYVDIMKLDIEHNARYKRFEHFMNLCSDFLYAPKNK